MLLYDSMVLHNYYDYYLSSISSSVSWANSLSLLRKRIAAICFLSSLSEFAHDDDDDVDDDNNHNNCEASYVKVLKASGSCKDAK